MALEDSAAAGWFGTSGRFAASGGAAANSTGSAAAEVEMEAVAMAAREKAPRMEADPIAISRLRFAGALPLSEPDISNFPKVAANSSRAPVEDGQLSW